MPTFNSILRPFGQETITVSNAAIQCSATLYDNISQIATDRNRQRKARGAKVENTSANAIRYTEDGTTPVAGGPGSILNQGDIKYLESYESIVKFKMIREGASNATADVEYYR